jgi:hypothetical protein
MNGSPVETFNVEKRPVAMEAIAVPMNNHGLK